MLKATANGIYNVSYPVLVDKYVHFEHKNYAQNVVENLFYPVDKICT
jgi:hypothetical protein